MSFLAVGSVDKSTVARTDSAADVFRSFCKEFKQLLLQKKYVDADDLLFRHSHFSEIFHRQKTFDCMLEFLLEDTANDQRYVQAARLTTILENQGYRTDFSRLCHASCLLKLGNLIDAKAVLQEASYPVGYVHEQILLHTQLGHAPEIELFTDCQEFMARAIAADTLTRQLQRLFEGGKYSEAEALLLEHTQLFSMFKSLRTFDKMLETLLGETKNADRYQQGLKMCTILKRHDLDTEYSDECQANCLAIVQKKSDRL